MNGLPGPRRTGKGKTALLAVTPGDFDRVVFAVAGVALVALGLPLTGEGQGEILGSYLVDAERADFGNDRWLAPHDSGQSRQEERKNPDEQRSVAAGSCDLCCPPERMIASQSLKSILPPVMGICIGSFR